MTGTAKSKGEIVFSASVATNDVPPYPGALISAVKKSIAESARLAEPPVFGGAISLPNNTGTIRPGAKSGLAAQDIQGQQPIQGENMKHFNGNTPTGFVRKFCVDAIIAHATRCCRVLKVKRQTSGAMPASQCPRSMGRVVEAQVWRMMRQAESRWPEPPAQFPIHKNPMRQIVFFLIGALLLVALLGLLLAQYLNISNPLKQSLLLLAAACLATYGAELLPKNRCKRPIVKRKLLLGASVALFGGAVLLLLNAFECHTILAWLGGHWGHGAGFAMAVAPLAVAEGELEEFRSTLSGLKSVGNKITDASHRLDLLERENNTLKADLNRLKKAGLAGGGSGVRWIGDVPFVSDDCATALTSVMVLECAKFDGGRGLEGMVKSGETRDRVLALARQTLAIETRAALTGTEIPLPTVYASQVMELVFKYGQARQFATQFPLGAGTVKLPRLKAGEDDFGYFGVGTAGMSQSITEKKVTAELVTFTANKAGGMIRIPYEIDSDTFIPIGQFLARYIARQLAKLEDKTLFLADGTATYANQTGVGPYCVANPSFLLQLAAGKTKPSDATLADFRNLRAKVGAAVLQGGFDAAYYLNPTWEPALRAFNTYPSFIVFDSTNGKPTLDGWPVRWIGVSQAYATTAVPSAFCAFFGALSYWFLGERGQPRIEVSRDVFFATDEIAMRALERIDVECLGVDSMAALQTAAS